MLRLVEQDVKTVTGQHLRTTLLLTDTGSIEQLQPEDIDNVNYYGDADFWRVLCIDEIMQMRAGDIDLPQTGRRKKSKLSLNQHVSTNKEPAREKASLQTNQKPS